MVDRIAEEAVGEVGSQRVVGGGVEWWLLLAFYFYM